MDSTSLLKPLFIFYVMLSNAGSIDLLGKQYREMIQENRLAKHVVTFSVLLTFVILYGENESVTQAVALSLGLYALFLMTTKLDVQWNIIVVTILLFAFLYETHTDIKEKKLKTDSTLDLTTAKNIVSQHKRNKMYIGAIIIGITVIAALLYSRKKQEQYGGGYDLAKFIFG